MLYGQLKMNLKKNRQKYAPDSGEGDEPGAKFRRYFYQVFYFRKSAESM